ncbi:hypothetical protein [Microbacterium terrisoli]|uniref:hypothetical protein n=1 Tax=Microbacterium terrisoli TaxID=3242192 RepID=UPI002805F610|nr:hypothetical protein [Microbacterium protaetiae]
MSFTVMSASCLCTSAASACQELFDDPWSQKLHVSEPEPPPEPPADDEQAVRPAASPATARIAAALFLYFDTRISSIADAQRPVLALTLLIVG